MSRKKRHSEEDGFQCIAGSFAELVEWLRSLDPALGAYLESHSVVDEQTGEICYTGDDRITFWGDASGKMPVKHLDPAANQPWPHPHPSVTQF
jgi:hypothetical protein